MQSISSMESEFNNAYLVPVPVSNISNIPNNVTVPNQCKLEIIDNEYDNDIPCGLPDIPDISISCRPVNGVNIIASDAPVADNYNTNKYGIISTTEYDQKVNNQSGVNINYKQVYVQDNHAKDTCVPPLFYLDNNPTTNKQNCHDNVSGYKINQPKPFEPEQYEQQHFEPDNIGNNTVTISDYNGTINTINTITSREPDNQSSVPIYIVNGHLNKKPTITIPEVNEYYVTRQNQNDSNNNQKNTNIPQRPPAILSPNSYHTFSPRSPVHHRSNVPITPISPLQYGQNKMVQDAYIHSPKSRHSTISDQNEQNHVNQSYNYNNYSPSTSPAPANINISNNSTNANANNVNVAASTPIPVNDCSQIDLKAYFAAVPIGEILQKNLSISQLVSLEVIGRLMTDQSGSRYLQRLLRNYNNLSEVSLMIKHCVDKHKLGDIDLVNVSEDVYGNYIVQLWFMNGTDSEKILLLDTFINMNFLRLSKSMYGCRVIQRCLSCVSDKVMLRKMVQCFDQQTKKSEKEKEDKRICSNSSVHPKGTLHECLICPYTNHVIQAILDLKLDIGYIKFIKNGLERNLSFYCEHVFGCRIIQCFIKNYGDKLNVLLLFLNDNHLYLSKLKYGNYVIQCIIDKQEWYSTSDIMKQFRNKLIEDIFHFQNIGYLSKNKFGSNVVEKCIKVSNRKQKNLLIYVLQSNHHIIPSMIKHCYGNYVIKALLNETNKKNQILLIKTIKFYCPNIKDNAENNKYCKDLVKEISKIEMNLNQRI